MVQESSNGPTLGSPFKRSQDDWLYTSAKFSSWKYPILLAPGLFKTFGNHFKNPSNNGTAPLGLKCSWECSKVVKGNWLSFHHLGQAADVPVTVIVVLTRIIQECLVWSGMLGHPTARVKGPVSAPLVQSKLVRGSWGHRADQRRRMQKHSWKKETSQKWDIFKHHNAMPSALLGGWHECGQVWPWWHNTQRLCQRSVS